MYTIYQIENLKTRKSYVGSTARIWARLRKHKSDHPEFFDDKYAIHELMYAQTKIEALQLERETILAMDLINPEKGYNKPWKRTKTLQQIDKHKISLKKYYETHCGPMSGKYHSAETKRKLTQAQTARAARGDLPFLGKKHSEETKKRISETRKAKIASGEIKIVPRYSFSS